MYKLISKLWPSNRENKKLQKKEKNFFSYYLIVHTHIEKCAGTSLNIDIANLVGNDYSYDLRHPELKRPKFMNQVERDNIKFLTGHFHFKDHMTFFTKSPLYIATVRDPVERFVSFVQYAKEREQHPAHSLCILPPEECMEKLLSERNHGVVSNGQCMALSKARTFEHARKNIIDNYLIVQPFYSVKNISNLFYKLLSDNNSFPVEANTYTNASKKNTVNLEPSTVKRIRELNSEDDKLFKWVCEHENKLLRKAEKTLNYLLS
jgi:hypothetical protein